MKYLLVTEFNEVFKSDEITENEISLCLEGELSVIEIETQRELLLRDNWANIPDWKDYKGPNDGN